LVDYEAKAWLKSNNSNRAVVLMKRIMRADFTALADGSRQLATTAATARLRQLKHCVLRPEFSSPPA
jgi:hypothetical protein